MNFRKWKFSKFNLTSTQNFNLFFRVKYIQISEESLNGGVSSVPDYFSTWLSVNLLIEYTIKFPKELVKTLRNNNWQQCFLDHPFRKNHTIFSFVLYNNNIFLLDFHKNFIFLFPLYFSHAARANNSIFYIF